MRRAKVFDGLGQARKEMSNLRRLLGKNLSEGGRAPKVVTFCFREDEGSVFYTNKKMAAARGLGIGFEVGEVSFALGVKELSTRIKKVGGEKKVTGVMIQKPMKKTYDEYFLSLNRIPECEFNEWWEKLRVMIPEAKDVDCLSPLTQQKIMAGEAEILPATVKAVLKIVAEEKVAVKGREVLIIGRTDLLGIPLNHFWRQQGVRVNLVGREGLSELLQSPDKLRKFAVIVSATGTADLIKGEMVGEGVVAIDVGWPKGDFEFASCVKKASLITPVPKGVGPLTVTSLLENVLILAAPARS